MAHPRIPKDYVNEGWAVLAHDYAGELNNQHYTKYPEELSHGNMKRQPVWTKYRDGTSIADPKEASDYIWSAIQRRALSFLLTQKEVDATRIGAKGVFLRRNNYVESGDGLTCKGRLLPTSVLAGIRIIVVVVSGNTTPLHKSGKNSGRGSLLSEPCPTGAFSLYHRCDSLV